MSGNRLAKIAALKTATKQLKKTISLAERVRPDHELNMMNREACGYSAVFGERWSWEKVVERYGSALWDVCSDEGDLVASLFCAANLFDINAPSDEIPMSVWILNAKYVLAKLTCKQAKLELKEAYKKE